MTKQRKIQLASTDTCTRMFGIYTKVNLMSYER